MRLQIDSSNPLDHLFDIKTLHMFLIFQTSNWLGTFFCEFAILKLNFKNSYVFPSLHFCFLSILNTAQLIDR